MGVRELMRQTRLRNVFLLRGAAIWVGVRFMLGLAKVGNPNPVLEGMVLGVVGADWCGGMRAVATKTSFWPIWAFPGGPSRSSVRWGRFPSKSWSRECGSTWVAARSARARPRGRWAGTVVPRARCAPHRGPSCYPGRVTALLGRNGVGKTTLFRIVVGRVRAEYGRVLYAGEYRRRPSLARLSREGLMYSSQESALTAHFTIREHLDAFVLRYGGGDRIPGLVESLVLEEFLDRRPSGLSGGERQRASLALARLRAPTCLLADEPFAGVAPRDRPLIREGLRGLADAGCGLAVSGHDVDDLLAVADDVVWMVAGTTHDLGTPAQAREHHLFRTDYLGPLRGR